MKYELDLTPEQAEQLQAALSHYTRIAREDALDYERGSRQHTFKVNSAELMNGVRSQIFRQGNPSPITLTPIENNRTHLRSPGGQWTRDTDHLNRIRQELLTNPGLAEAKTSDRGRSSREDFPDVSDEVWAEQRGVMQIMADDMGIDTPESYTTRRLGIDPLREADPELSNKPVFTTQRAIRPERIQKALESRGLGDDSTYEYTGANGIALRLSQDEDRVKVDRVYESGNTSPLYDSHRNDSDSPNLYIVFDNEERQATLEALNSLENVREIEDISAGRAPEEFLQAFAQGIEQLKRDNPMGLDPETGELVARGGAKERIERNLKILEDTVRESSPDLMDNPVYAEASNFPAKPNHADAKQTAFYNQLYKAANDFGEHMHGVNDLVIGDGYEVSTTDKQLNIFKDANQFHQIKGAIEGDITQSLESPITITKGSLTLEQKEFIAELIAEREARRDNAIDHGYWRETSRDSILNGLPMKDQLEASGELDYVQALANKANEFPYSEETMQKFLDIGGDTIEELQATIDELSGVERVTIDKSLSSNAELNDFFVKAYNHADKFGTEDPGIPITTARLDDGVEIQVDMTEAEVWLKKDGEHLGSADMPILADGPKHKVLGFERIENDGITPELQKSAEQSMGIMEHYYGVGDREQDIYDDLSANPDMTMGEVMDRKRELAGQSNVQNPVITDDQLKGQILALSHKLDDLDPESREYSATANLRSMYEDTLAAKAYGEELVRPEHPQIETYQAIFDAVHEHGDGDYGVTQLDLDNGVMLQSEYSGASVFKDGNRVASAQSLSQGSYGVHHPISVEGELSPELQKNIEVSIESLGKSSDRDHDFTGAPSTTYERSTLEQSQVYTSVSAELVIHGTKQDGRLWGGIGKDYDASISEDGGDLQIHKEEDMGFDLAYVQASCDTAPSLNNLDPSELRAITTIAREADDLPGKFDAPEVEQPQLSMFDLVGSVMDGSDPMDGMDATIARDIYGTSVEVLGPSEAIKENENTRFFNVVHAATVSRGDATGHGIRRLDLGDGMAALTDGDNMVISQTDGQGNERVIYEQSKGTSHLGGIGETHSDRIPQATKKKVWEKTVSENLHSTQAKTRTRAKIQKSVDRDDGVEI